MEKKKIKGYTPVLWVVATVCWALAFGMDFVNGNSAVFMALHGLCVVLCGLNAVLCLRKLKKQKQEEQE